MGRRGEREEWWAPVLGPALTLSTWKTAGKSLILSKLSAPHPNNERSCLVIRTYSSGQAHTFRGSGFIGRVWGSWYNDTPHKLEGLPSTGSACSLPCFPSGLFSSLPKSPSSLVQTAMAWSQMSYARMGFFEVYSPAWACDVFLPTWFPSDPARICLADPQPRPRVKRQWEPLTGLP